MIKLIDKIPAVQKPSAAFVKICCHFAAYSNYKKIALFWAQYDENKKLGAVMSMIDGVMMLHFCDGDIEELSSFLSAVSPKKVFTDSLTAKALGLNIEVECSTLYIKPPFFNTDCIENTYCGIDKLYSILSSRLNIGEYEVFVADFSHRIRHNCAGYVSSEFSAAAILFDANYAVINGIAVCENSQRKGLGSATLNRLLNDMHSRTVYVCAEEKNVPFYLKNGFIFDQYAAYCNTFGVF